MRQKTSITHIHTQLMYMIVHIRIIVALILHWASRMGNRELFLYYCNLHAFINELREPAKTGISFPSTDKDRNQIKSQKYQNTNKQNTKHTLSPPMN